MRGTQSHLIDFYASLVDSESQESPIEKDFWGFVANVLECCELYEPSESFDDFCADFGYSNDSIRALKIHQAVLEQYSGLLKVFGQDQLEKLARIIFD